MEKETPKNSTNTGIHIPVLLKPLQKLFQFPPDAVIVDATVGQAGHAGALAAKLNRNGILIGLDVDSDSLAVAKSRLKDWPCRIELVRENFSWLDKILKNFGIEKVNIILADLGICSGQLAAANRGISYQRDGPLDMRLDDRLETTAADLINRLRQEELANLIYRYGEERKSRRIARAIVEARRAKPIERTGELVDVICRALGVRATSRKSRIHPATRSFQALRIAVNDELGHLERLLAQGPRLLKTGGQIAVISFHSLEDRLVKTSFRAYYQAGHYEIQTKKPLRADEEERQENPRSRSAKLRVARRTDQAYEDTDKQKF